MIRILLDPGHAWNGNHYALQPGHYEGTQMWKLANYLKPELERYGFEVVTTRPNLKDFHGVNERGKMAKGFDLVLSLHTNAIPGNDKVTGTFIYRTISTPEIKPLADDMGQRIADLMGHRYRGCITKESTNPLRKGKDYNGVLRNAIAVGCKAGLLLEHGFHTNPKDCAYLVKDENLKRLAVAEAEAVAEYYGTKGDEGDLMLKRTLRHGDSGEDVGLVQQFLKNHGYYTGPVDNKFGPGTGFLNAVIAFQKAENLENPNGNIGPITRARIIEMMIEAPKSVDDPQVKELQAKVASLEAELARVQNLAREIIG